MTNCVICRHPDREKIEQQPIHGVPLREIAEPYKFSHVTVRNHGKHIKDIIAKGTNEIEVSSADRLLRECEDMRNKALSLMQQAEDKKDIRTAISALRAMKDIVELYAKVAGELNQVRTINVFMSPQWIQLKQIIVQSLEGFPDARAVVLNALTDEEGKDTTAIRFKA